VAIWLLLVLMMIIIADKVLRKREEERINTISKLIKKMMKKPTRSVMTQKTMV